MTTDSCATVFHVSNLDKSLAFYTEVLGLKKMFQYGAYAGLEMGHLLIFLSGPNQGGLKRAVGQGQIYAFCDEVDEYFQEVKAKGADIIDEPEDRPYDMRDFAIRDLDGNILTFGKGLQHETQA